MKTSDRQNAANVENAKKSTGPKTSEGKSKSSRNALKHGLSSPGSGQDLIDEVVLFQRELNKHINIPEDKQEILHELAYAEVVLQYIQEKRSITMSGLEGLQCERILLNLQALLRLERYKTRALSKREKAIAKMNSVIDRNF